MWEDQAKYCPLCGSGLETGSVGGRTRLRCGRCPFVLYRNPASAALGVVLDPAARVLLIRRAIEPFRGHWALPAGYQEADESPEEALVREVREESGLEVESLGLLELTYTDSDPRKPANVAVYLCRPTGGELVHGQEEVDVGWFSLDALPSPIGFDNYERILRRLTLPEGYPVSPWGVLRTLLTDA